MEELYSPSNEDDSVNTFAKNSPLELISVYSMLEPYESVLLYEGAMEIKYASQEA